MELLSGDSYKLSFKIKRDDIVITDADIKEVEIIINKLRKTYTEGTVTYDGTPQVWNFPLSQEETFQLKEGTFPAQIRVKFMDNTVIGKQISAINIRESISKEVL